MIWTFSYLTNNIFVYPVSTHRHDSTNVVIVSYSRIYPGSPKKLLNFLKQRVQLLLTQTDFEDSLKTVPVLRPDLDWTQISFKSFKVLFITVLLLNTEHDTNQPMD